MDEVEMPKYLSLHEKLEVGYVLSCVPELRLNYQEKNQEGGPCGKIRSWYKVEI